MPYFRPSFRRVDFDLTPDYSRPAGDDEAYVVKAYTRHASHCPTCAHPYEVHKRGGTLCAKGHQRALDVAQYLYNKNGQVYSVVDREGNKRIHVEIPPGCEVVRGLLKALERGLRLHREAQPVSYDRSYHVAPRRVQPERSYHVKEARPVRKPHFETSELPKTHGRHRREKPYGRGSLFEEDRLERESRYNSQPIYYMAAPKGAPVIPRRDHSWR